jgi:hypothetical protein
MAIIKTKVLPNGVSGNYWVIRGIYMSPDVSNTRAFADLYVDAAASVSGTPIHQADIILDGINNPFHQSNMEDIVEAQLITMPGDFLSGIQV